MSDVSPKTIDELFQQMGGPTAVARILAVGVSTASEMKRRGSVPVRYWPKLITHAQSQGTPLTESDLLAAHVASDGPDAVKRPVSAAPEPA